MFWRLFFEVREADKGAASARAMAAYIQHGNLAQVVPLLPRQNACNKWQRILARGSYTRLQKFCKRVCTGIRLSAESNHSPFGSSMNMEKIEMANTK